jgi:hypothetical protein
MSVDFQRLAQVRARQSSRRKRWLRLLWLLGIAVVIAAGSQLPAPVLPARRLASWVEQRLPFLGGNGAPVVEEAQGRVQIVEPGTGLIRVSSGPFGLMSVELVVSAETLIVVGDKEGGFGDLRDGGQVKAAYEVRPGALRAKRVEVIVRAD